MTTLADQTQEDAYADALPFTARPRPARSPARVLVAGAGVAGLEALLALRQLLGDGIELMLVGREPKFLNRSMSVDQPFKPRRVRGLGLEAAARDLGARWQLGTIDRVEPDRHRVITRDGTVMPYDRLVLAVGARPDRGWDGNGVLTYHGGQDGPAYRLLLQRLRDGKRRSVAFVRQPGPSWPMPIYDLAFMTAAECLRPGCSDLELSLITTEDEPLEIFGHAASTEVRQLLNDRGIALHTGSYAVPRRSGWLRMSPGGIDIRIGYVVTQPRLRGPSLRGIPCDRDGFIRTDAYGRVTGVDDVFAAGDATAFPIKQGGLAAQQADAVAETIAASIGAGIEPHPFRPVLRGVLLTGEAPRYLRADISGGAGENSTISTEPLWQPAVKLGGRFLGPYLAGMTGSTADVMPSPPSFSSELADLATPSLQRT